MTGWFVVWNEGMVYPMPPHIYPRRESVGYRIPPFPTKSQRDEPCNWGPIPFATSIPCSRYMDHEPF